MAQNITLMGANYSAVPAVTLPKTGGGIATFTDVTGTTATASDVASGKVFYASDGTETTGTASGGGGSSSWTLVASTSYQVNTTSTSSTLVGTLTCSESIWTYSDIIYVCIRDTEGKRNGYFYGSDTLIYNSYGNETSDTVYSNMGRWIWRGTTTGYTLRQATSTTVYGIAPGGSIVNYEPYDISIYARYNSSYSGTINSTYSVKVYKLTPPFTLFD